MGTSPSTCCLSGLPILGGDKVRWLLLTQNPYRNNGTVFESHGRWFPRTWPIQAIYDGYQSIESWEDNEHTQAILKGFYYDLIELEQDSIDPALQKDLSFKDLLGALQQNRVCVLRKVPRASFPQYNPDLYNSEGEFQPPEYIPTQDRVEFLIKDIKLPKYGKFVVLVQDGFTEVQYQGASKDVDRILREALEVLEDDYACVITASTLGSIVESTLKLFVKPGKNSLGGHRTSQWKNPDIGFLRVRPGMIREDVWQAVKTISIKEFESPEELGIQTISFLKEFKKAKSEGYRYGMDQFSLEQESKGFSPFHSFLLQRELIPFTVGLSRHAKILLDNESIEDFGALIGEFTHIFYLMLQMGRLWHPSDYSGDGQGYFSLHSQSLMKFYEISRVLEKENTHY